jgi:hypothetical protein
MTAEHYRWFALALWMPVNLLVVRALFQYYSYYGNHFLVECPTGSGRQMNLYQVAKVIARRLAAIFLRDGEGRRLPHAFFRDDQTRELPGTWRLGIR